MEQRAVFQAAFAAACIATVCLLVMAGVMIVAGREAPLQSSVPPASAEAFMQPLTQRPQAVLGFFAADSLFVLSYSMVFLGLYATVAGRARLLAAFGLAAGLLAALADTIENAHYVTYTLAALHNTAAGEPNVATLYLFVFLKWAAAFAAFFAFGLAWPRQGWLNWLIAGLMLLFVLVGILGIALPGLITLRSLFFLAGMPLFAIYFWQRARAA